jgi:UDP-galactopyranose mutase
MVTRDGRTPAFQARLAQYRYFNTDEVIQEALACFQTIRDRCAAPASLHPAV